MTRAAVADYLRREAAAMATPWGADHESLLALVALEYRMNLQILRNAVKAATIARPN